MFLDNLDPAKYRTDFEIEGSCNYAFTLVLKQPDAELARKAEETMRQAGVEFRRGTAGGSNQLRQPYACENSWATGNLKNIPRWIMFTFTVIISGTTRIWTGRRFSIYAGC